MERYLQRNRNKAFLAALVGAQLVLLAYQVRQPNAGGVRRVRMWSIEAILPAERISQRLVGDAGGWWHGYVTLRRVNQRNRALENQLAQLELQNQQLREQVRELPQLNALLGFQRSYGLRTQAAEVISSGASADAQAIYLGRGASAGLRRNMAVVTAQGVVGKLSQVLSSTAQVLLVTDPDSGVGALVGANGVHGILHGLGAGRVELRNILKDEPVTVGEAVITSGEDQVYPKGIPIGTVSGVGPSTDGVFKTATVKLAADLGRLEQVLVVTGGLPPPSEMPDSGLTAAAVRQAQLPGLPAMPGAAAPAAPGAPAKPGSGGGPGTPR